MAILDWLIGPKLDNVLAGIKSVHTRLDSVFNTLKELPRMSQALDRIREEVTEAKTVATSAVQLLTSLAEQIRDLKDDPAALEALADELDQSNADLAAAVAANTTAEAEPEAPAEGEETTGE
jgi:uncharacterized protein (DUF3084 family)